MKWAKNAWNPIIIRKITISIEEFMFDPRNPLSIISMVTPSDGSTIAAIM